MLGFIPVSGLGDWLRYGPSVEFNQEFRPLGQGTSSVSQSRKNSVTDETPGFATYDSYDLPCSSVLMAT